MHSLTICLGLTSWTLLFKTEERSKSAYELFSNPLVENLIVTDDFGQCINAKASSIHGFVLEDMETSQGAAVERGLHQARAQAKAQERAMADPIIKESIRRQQMGPAVYQPGMPNGSRIM